MFYEKATTSPASPRTSGALTPRLTLSLGLRYDLEVVPIAETDDPLVDGYPVDKNNFQPRIGVTYDLGGGKSVVRGGYGRFFDKTHFELIGGLYTGTPFTDSFVVNFPTRGRRPRGTRRERGAELPTDPFLVNGPVINRTLLDQQFPAGTAAAQHRRQLGQRRSRACRTPTSSRSATSGSSAATLAVSADYVHALSRDLLISKDLNPGLRATTARDVAAGAAGERPAERGLCRAAGHVSGVRQLHDWRDAAREHRRARLRRAAPQRQQALRPELRGARLVHAVRRRAATPLATASRRAASRCSTICTSS